MKLVIFRSYINNNNNLLFLIRKSIDMYISFSSDFYFLSNEHNYISSFSSKTNSSVSSRSAMSLWNWLSNWPMTFFRSIHQYRWILRVKNHRLASEYPCRNVRKFRASKFPQKGRHIKFHFLHFSNFSCLPVFLFFKLILWLASHLQEILSSRVQVMSRWRSAEIPLCDHFDCNLFSIFVIA